MAGDDDLGGLREELHQALGERYELGRELGRGGAAVVFLARDSRHERDVALKVLRPDVGSSLGAERFLREIRLVSRLAHPHILSLYDSGVAGQLLYYVTPYVAGESLRQQLDSGEALPAEMATRLACELCDALAYAHEHQVVHRDIKPENILVLEGHALLADFGIARALDAVGSDRLTALGAAIGTPRYMSPEQASAEADVGTASDIYSLGCVLYEMFAGDPPFTGTPRQVLLSHVTRQPPSLLHRKDLSEDVARAIGRCLSKRPEDWPASASELGAAFRAAAARPAPASSVAVLPFENLSDDADLEYFSDGVTEEIMGAIAQLPALRVTGRTSSFALKGKALDLDHIGQTLRVSAVVTGSVRRAGGRVRIAVQLVNVADGFQLWSDRFDRELSDVFALQDEIAQAVAERLVPRSQSKVALASTVATAPGVDAYDAYLVGKSLRNKLEPGALQDALRHFERALVLDPEFALPSAAIADAHVLLAIGFAVGSHREALGRARDAAQRALAVAPELPEAHLARALVALFLEWRFDAAHDGLRRALELRPSFADAHMWSEFYWTYVRRDYEGALAELQRALVIDPLYLPARVRLATAHYLFGRYELAHVELDEVVARAPDLAIAHLSRGDTLLREGRLDEAVAACERAIELGGRAVAFLGVYAIACALRGHEGPANEVLLELQRIGDEDDTATPNFWIGIVLSALGRIDEGLQRLESACDERDSSLLYLTFIPRVPGLHEHPRYAGLVRRIGLRSPG